jgi:hypothetical protein
MQRQTLTDGTNRWFDLDKVKTFKEARQFDGRNHISLATGTQWDHETLYRTASGHWILHAWSQWQGSRETYEEIDNEQAAAWLVRNEYEPHESCATEYAALEID